MRQRIIYSDHKTRIIISGVDTLKDRREVLTERFFKRHILLSSSLLHYLLPDRRENDTVVSDIHNHSTNCGLVLPDFATVVYHIA